MICRQATETSNLRFVISGEGGRHKAVRRTDFLYVISRRVALHVYFVKTISLYAQIGL